LDIRFTDTITVEVLDGNFSDSRVCVAARTSTQGAGASDEERYGLINALMRDRHGCYDDQTEVLTADGWKLWPDVDGTEQFVTLNIDTDEIELQRPERLVVKPVDEDLVRIKMAQVDALVTEDHNMLAAPRRHGPDEYRLVKARDFLRRSYRIRMGGGEWRGDLHCPETAALIGFIAADGSCTSGGQAEFHLSKDRKIEWLTSNYPARQRHDSARRAQKYVVDLTGDAQRWAKATYTATGDRCLPRELLQRADTETLQALLDGYLVGDGHVSPTGRITATTVSRQMIDDLQELALKVGMAAVETAPDHIRSGAYGSRPLLKVTFYRDRNITPRVGWTQEARREQVSLTPYRGNVYCVTVPNGTLYVRRNGKPMWCGNTPFEHMNATFRVTAPIFVWREHHRHRSGFCVAGDMRVPVGTEKNGRTKAIKDIYRDWHEGVPDSLGRNRKLPSCRNLATRTLNLDTGLVEAARMVDVYQSGVKPIIELRLETDARTVGTLRCTKDHQVWTPDGWVKAGDLQVGDKAGRIGLVAYGEAPKVYSKKLREGIGIWTSQQRHMIQDVDTCHRCGGIFAKDELELDHVVPVCESLKLALDEDNLSPICTPCHDVKSREETSRNYENRRQRASGVRFERIVSIQKVGEEMTYDLEMPGPYHNFIANGWVVHNSYNEESGRYKQLDPVFYVPGETRPIAKVEGTRNMDYVLEKGTADQHALIANAMWATCSDAYRQYEAMLDAGIVREVARMVLPVNIMSTCIVTCNARSLMHFLSLRQRHDDAKFPSKPQYEINLVADGYEMYLAEAAPLVHRSFVENGRVAP